MKEEIDQRRNQRLNLLLFQSHLAEEKTALKMNGNLYCRSEQK